jgi:two-component system phosphate regulon response regulator OmpR
VIAAADNRRTAGPGAAWDYTPRSSLTGETAMTDAIRVLVVDDDPSVREILEDYLADQGFAAVAVDNAAAARDRLDAEPPQLVLLDVGLPGEDGLSLARYVREHFDIGIIMVSGAGETVDRIVGLEVGADDYVAKPFDLRELQARLKSVLRRYQRGGEPALSTDARGPDKVRVAVGGSVLDRDRRQLFAADGSEIPLTRMEYELLEVLVARPNRPLSRDQLLQLTQNRDWDPTDRSLDIRIARLRSKIEPDPDRPRLIQTVRGIGYRYVPS